MKQTAEAFSKAAASIGQMAEFMKPADSDRYTQQQNLAVFHLRTAAKIARDIAEGHAQREGMEPKK